MAMKPGPRPTIPVPQPTNAARAIGMQSLLAQAAAVAGAQQSDPEGSAPPAAFIPVHEMGLTGPYVPDPDQEPDHDINAQPPRARLHEPSEAGLAAQSALLAAGRGAPSADQPQGLPEPAAPFVRMSKGQRVPFGVREQKLAWPPIPGFHLHWFNDDPGRIMRAEAAGYAHVLTRTQRPVATIVGVDRSGKPLTAFLMKIPNEWYDEDMEALEAEQATILQAIKSGRFKAGDNSYVPAQGIKMDSSLRR